MPTSVISYWKTKLRGKTLSWAGEHESFMYVFNTEELTAAEARIRKAAKEISEAYERYQNSVIGERMFKYAEITKELKELEKKKELIKNDLIDLLKDNKMAMDVHGALVSYSTYQRKSYTYSKNIVNKEYEIEQMKKEEINTGVAEEHSKTVTLILVKDGGYANFIGGLEVKWLNKSINDEVKFPLQKLQKMWLTEPVDDEPQAFNRICIRYNDGE